MPYILETLNGKVSDKYYLNRRIEEPNNSPFDPQITDPRGMFPIDSISNESIREIDIAKLRTGTLQSQIITMGLLDGAGDVILEAGTVNRAAWTANPGFIMGIDDSASNAVKWYIGNSTNWVDWNVTTANTLTIAGSLVASQIHIPDENTTAN